MIKHILIPVFWLCELLLALWLTFASATASHAFYATDRGISICMALMALSFAALTVGAALLLRRSVGRL